MGNLLTIILAVLVIGYGLYQFVKDMKRQTKGKCSGCSCDCSSCDETKKIIILSEEDKNKK